MQNTRNRPIWYFIIPRITIHQQYADVVFGKGDTRLLTARIKSIGSFFVLIQLNLPQILDVEVSSSLYVYIPIKYDRIAD